jgi:hypothetical protein
MKIGFLSLFALAVTIPTGAVAMLTGEVRDDFLVATYYACERPKGSKQLTAEDQAKKSRLCNCFAAKMADTLDIETVKLLESGQQTLDQTLLTEAAQWCKEHYADFEAAPPASRTVQTKGTKSSLLFNGRTHRFTAFRQHVYTKDFQLLRTVELQNGRYLYDLQIQADRSAGSLSAVAVHRQYSLVAYSGSNQKLAAIGYDWAFLMKNPDGNDGVLVLDSGRNILATQLFNAADGLFYETHYVRSQALICVALKEARTRVLTSAAASVFKEILLVAIRSYAGTSYSGGNFTAYTASGQTVAGTYTRYDNSWLGEHYSRGLNVVFAGTASLAEINREMERLDCSAV